MVRPKKPRLINFKPEITNFSPQGKGIKSVKEIILSFDELEAIRLADFNQTNQVVAAKKMKISQSTFQRILKKARHKIAKALILVKTIRIKGGDIIMNPKGFGRGMGRRRGQGAGRGRMGGPFSAGPGGVCVCVNPECKHEAPHQAGVPCYQMKCPKCGSPMIRRN